MLDDDLYLYLDLDLVVPLDASRSSLGDTTIDRGGPDYPPDGIAAVRLDQVHPVPVVWLWRGYLPHAKVVVLEGEPAAGKSTLLMDLAARVSTGGTMPDGQRLPGPADVVVMSAEDGVADTVTPRLLAAGADMTRIHAISQWLSLPADIDRLEAFLDYVGPAILIVDPFIAYLQKANLARETEVRKVMDAFTGIAERTGTTIILVRHLYKGTARQALYRGMGGIGVAAVARVVLLAGRDPEDEAGERRVLAVTKAA